jgi:hypothetical protein
MWSLLAPDEAFALSLKARKKKQTVRPLKSDGQQQTKAEQLHQQAERKKRQMQQKQQQQEQMELLQLKQEEQRKQQQSQQFQELLGMSAVCKSYLSTSQCTCFHSHTHARRNQGAGYQREYPEALTCCKLFCSLGIWSCY